MQLHRFNIWLNRRRSEAKNTSTHSSLNLLLPTFQSCFGVYSIAIIILYTNNAHIPDYFLKACPYFYGREFPFYTTCEAQRDTLLHYLNRRADTVRSLQNDVQNFNSYSCIVFDIALSLHRRKRRYYYFTYINSFNVFFQLFADKKY